MIRMDKTLYSQHGIDVDSLLSRCMNNEAFAQKFLMKFLNDENFQKLLSAVQAKDSKKMLEAAHTLKGVSGNLSLSVIYDLSDKICTSIRNDDLDEAISYIDPLEDAYNTVVDFLNTKK